MRVRGGDQRPVFVRGAGMNRAVDGDIVAVEVLPKAQWAAPSGVIERKDDARLLIEGGKIEDDAVVGSAIAGSAELEPTGLVVG